LLAGLGYTFKEWSQNSSIPVTLIGHGRERVFGGLDITRTSGWISVGYPVILEMDFAADISRQVNHIKKTLSQVPNNGIGHDILKYITLPENKPSLEFRLNPEIMFNFLGQVDSSQEANEEPLPYAISPLSQFIGHDITMTYNTDRDFTFMIVLSIKEGTLRIEINYHKDEYQERTITGIIADYAGHLRKIINHYLSGE
jgi:fengycin family lipopeptide synthetase D/gramicidin S synthase 2/tyrocidine synthetase-2